MPETLPEPEIIERNSERQSQWIGIAIGVLVVILTVIDQLLGAGVIPAGSAAYVILGGLATALAPIVKYQSTRGALKVARELAKRPDPTSPPSSP